MLVESCKLSCSINISKLNVINEILRNISFITNMTHALPIENGIVLILG